MAAYYVQPRPPTVSTNLSTRSQDVVESSRHPDALTSQDDISPDRSIYIFPSPSSDPPTPVPASPGSSLLSAPTEYDFSEFSSLGIRSRTSSYMPSGAASPSEGDVVAPQRRVSSSLPDDEMEIDVELWELSTDPEQGIDSSSDSSWVLEDEVERVSAGGIDFSYLAFTRQPRRTHRLSTPSMTEVVPSQQYWAVHRRARTHSRIRTISSLSSTRASSATRRPSPNPRIHVPLLSFFSSLLSIDLDDPALRLLTHADPGEAQSVLFPGHTTSQLLAGHDTAALDHHRAGRDGDSDSDSVFSEEELHGMPKLLLASISDQSTVALRSLRAGLAVCMPQPPGVGLSIPNPAELHKLWQAVGEVCVRGSRAWRQVWRSGRSDS